MSKQNLTYKPSHFYTHPIMGKVAVYHESKYRGITGSGCSADFFLNGAKPDDENHYAIKLFKTSVEAFAAFQRQTLAAKEYLAPPTGHMVQFVMRNKNRTKNRWGYTTCVARIDEHSVRKAIVLASGLITNLYHRYCLFYNLAPKMDEQSLADFSYYMNDSFDEGEQNLGGFGDLANRMIDCGSLLDMLSDIDISATQYDGDYDYETDRMKLGNARGVSEHAMCHDLHSGNIGLWRGNPVCIDFGHHIVSTIEDRHDIIFSMDDVEIEMGDSILFSRYAA